MHLRVQIAIGDMDDIFNSEHDSLVRAAKKDIERCLETAEMACIDGNVSERDIGEFTSLCKQHGVACWFEPTTPEKAVRLVRSGALRDMAYLSPNETELRAMWEAVTGSGQAEECVSGMAEGLLRLGGGGVMGQCLLVTRGENGVCKFRMRKGKEGWVVERRDFAAGRVERVRNTTGAGDCFAGRCIGALVRGVEEEDAIRLGMEAAEECCRKVNEAMVSAKL